MRIFLIFFCNILIYHRHQLYPVSFFRVTSGYLEIMGVFSGKVKVNKKFSRCELQRRVYWRVDFTAQTASKMQLCLTAMTQQHPYFPSSLCFSDSLPTVSSSSCHLCHSIIPVTTCFRMQRAKRIKWDYLQRVKLLGEFSAPVS